MAEATARKSTRELLGGATIIVLCGASLGLIYNGFGIISDHPWGLSWIGKDKMSLLAEAELVESMCPESGEDAAAADDYWTAVSDPLAVPEGAGDIEGLPEIPDAGRPVQIELRALKRYFDADAALIIDARDPDEYDGGHIAGAINLPYHDAVDDPSSLRALETRGRPIITYCGGGSCEVSLTVAEELSSAGHDRIAVYIGGFSEWVEAGYPVGSRP
jgi:rhodanese-related sulfurtransferase